LLVVGALAMLSIVVASCGSSNSSGSGSSTTSSGGATSGTSTAASPKVLKVALIEDMTGSFAPISGPQPSQAFIKDLNDNGGLNGTQIETTVYDGQSTAAGTLQAARRAVQTQPAGILMGSWNATSANAFLATTGIPVVGFGAIGGYAGYDNVFSDIGEAAVHSSDVWMRILKLKGATKIAILNTTIQAKFGALLKRLAPSAGVQIVYDNETLPYPVDSPTALSLARAVKDSGATGVFAAAGGDLVQADLNQLGVKVSVLEVSAFGPAVIKQWGPKVNGMIFGSSFASAYVKNNPAVDKYVADMKKYGYDKFTYNNPYAIEHYAATKMLFDGMKAAGAPYDKTATVAALNKLHRYTAGGLLPFVSFPEWHKSGTDCAATATVVNGQWVADKNGTNPFTCSKSGSVGF
jgi:ABC-type branched-subunit amino acid transport system substrate-binding protein